MTSTTDRGNAFRDEVASLLRAAGFQADTEVLVDFKNVDVSAVMVRDDVAGPSRYAFEAKDYGDTLPLGQCTKFINDYQPIVRGERVDHAWLISKGDITPKGRTAFEKAGRGIRGMTFAELQRRLLLLDPYLRTLVSEHDRSRLADYYIRPETPEGEDLESHVRGWMSREKAAPLFVLGPYGKGKSTFATHLAASLAREALSDASARVPILVRLGEIADEQSIEGLLGKVLASQHRVQNYHFEAFSALNRAGRFLVIYDGLDEMKHGLTPAKFQTVLSDLMRLDEGDARILVLGRDTAFHDDVEFRAVIDGMQRTSAGREIPILGRRPYGHVTIRGFTTAEARIFVERYLPVRAAQETEGPATDPAWIAARVAELTSGRFDTLLERPVHANMLCEIAIQPDQLRADMSVYELFDSFVHYLLEREVKKRGRDRDFSLDVRRRFNASLAWWLWDRGGASTTTLTDIPQGLCDDAVRGLSHSLNREEMRRELIQGCLIEKGPNTIYFHRSLQEFLVAEHLIETDLLQRSNVGSNWLLAATKSATPEVIEFIIAGARISQPRRDRAIRWFDGLATATAFKIPLGGFDLFSQLARHLDITVQIPNESAWLSWVAFFQRTGARDFKHRDRNTLPVVQDMLIASRRSSTEAQAAALYLAARVLRQNESGRGNDTAKVIAATLPIKRLLEVTAAAEVKRSERQIVSMEDDFALWAILRSMKVGPDKQKVLAVTLDLAQLRRDVGAKLPGSLESDSEAISETATIAVQGIYQALGGLKPPVKDGTIEGLRPFFNNPEVRALIAPIEIERRGSLELNEAGSEPGPPRRATLKARFGRRS